MHRHEKILSRFESLAREHLRLRDFFAIMFDDFMNWVAGDEDAPALDSFAQQVHPAAFRIGHQYVAAVIDDATIDLFGHAVIVAAISSLHVIDGNAESLCNDGR